MQLVIETRITDESAHSSSWCPLCNGSLCGLAIKGSVNSLVEINGFKELKYCENCGLLFLKGDEP